MSFGNLYSLGDWATLESADVPPALIGNGRLAPDAPGTASWMALAGSPRLGGL
ncbi:MAG: hypothetical protein ACRD4P_09825 [Bryobacteraceae bacterium]